MQIQLKQTEIIAALKQYIVGQGINLTGKDVTGRPPRSSSSRNAWPESEV